jgi:hypothetical protein
MINNGTFNFSSAASFLPKTQSDAAYNGALASYVEETQMIFDGKQSFRMCHVF